MEALLQQIVQTLQTQQQQINQLLMERNQAPRELSPELLFQSTLVQFNEKMASAAASSHLNYVAAQPAMWAEFFNRSSAPAPKV